ncbi:MAG: hypothetical protein WBF53_00830 [Litorimonas sp.]
MVTLREFISNRQAEIQSQMSALRSEQSELKVALAALEGDAAQGGARRQPNLSNRLTIKDMIVDVLGKRRDGGTSDDIIEWVKEVHGAEVPRSSMSPQLSRLKSEGAITLDNSNKIWRLASQEDHSPSENSSATEPEEAKAEHVRTMPGLLSINSTPPGQ